MRTCWVTFDCFGTLIDWQSGFSTIWRPVAGNKTAGLLDAYHQFEPQVQAEVPFRLYQDVLEEATRRAARRVGLALSDSQARLLPERWGTLPVFADVEPALAALRATGCKIAVLTNCDDDLFERTQQSFRRAFDLVITAERVRAYKPAHNHFHSFARAAGVAAADWVHAANSWFHDICPARDLGLRHIWLDRDREGEDKASGSVRICSAADLPAAVAAAFHARSR